MLIHNNKKEKNRYSLADAEYSAFMLRHMRTGQDDCCCCSLNHRTYNYTGLL